MNVEDILIKRGEEAVRKIQANINSASGKTAKSVRSEVEGDSKKVTLTIVGGRQFFPAVETGSKPSSKNPSPEYVESLKEWMEIRGKQGSPYGLAKGILKRGSKLWRDGGRRDVYTNVKNETLKLIASDLKKYAKDKLVDVLKA